MTGRPTTTPPLQPVEMPSPEEIARGAHPAWWDPDRGTLFGELPPESPPEPALPLEILFRRLLGDRPGVLLGVLGLAGLPFLLVHGPFWATRLGIEGPPTADLVYGLTWIGYLVLLGLLGLVDRFSPWGRPRSFRESMAAGLMVIAPLLGAAVSRLPADLMFQVIAGSLAGISTVVLAVGTLDVFERRYLKEDGLEPGPSGGVLRWAGLLLWALGGAAVLILWAEPGTTALSERWFGIGPPEWVKEWMEVIDRF